MTAQVDTARTALQSELPTLVSTEVAKVVSDTNAALHMEQVKWLERAQAEATKQVHDSHEDLNARLTDGLKECHERIATTEANHHDHDHHVY
eukprot:2038527-Amphidinium_carterae.2